MSRTPALFMVTLLLVSMIPVSFAQENLTEAQATADAHRDVNQDMKESLWFMSGLVGSSVGFAAGGIGACLSGLIIDFNPDTSIPSKVFCEIFFLHLSNTYLQEVCDEKT